MNLTHIFTFMQPATHSRSSVSQLHSLRLHKNFSFAPLLINRDWEQVCIVIVTTIPSILGSVSVWWGWGDGAGTNKSFSIGQDL